MGTRHDRPDRVLVIGGGISGLAAAHALATSADPPRITVIEASDRLGGVILTTPFAGLPAVDAGPDAFLARVPEGLALAGAVGLTGAALTSPSTGAASVWWEERLHPLPEGLVLGVPAGLTALARSRLLSTRGKLRAAAEPLLPRRDVDDDLGLLIRSRFGPEVLERLVGPLVGGINAGDPDRMSIATVTPQLAGTLLTHRSLLLGLRAVSRATAGSAPVFVAPAAGMGALVEHVASALHAAGVAMRTGTPAAPLEREGRGWRSGEHEADAIVIATSASAARDLLAPIAPDVARDLGSFEAVSVALVTLAFDATEIPPPSGSGYLVPRRAQRTITACSWASTKWPHWRRPGQLLVRASAGRSGAEAAAHLDDDALLTGVLTDLRDQAAIRAAPTAVRITRWPRSMPQYPPGHLGRVADVEERLARVAPGVVLAGAAYRGVGIPSCIRQAFRAAGRAGARAEIDH